MGMPLYEEIRYSVFDLCSLKLGKFELVEFQLCKMQVMRGISVHMYNLHFRVFLLFFEFEQCVY